MESSKFFFFFVAHLGLEQVLLIDLFFSVSFLKYLSQTIHASDRL